MEWFWPVFNFLCGAAGLAGLWLAVRAESRAKSVEVEVRNVVGRNRRILLSQEVLTAIGDGKLVLAASERPVQMLHLDRLRDAVAGIQASRELSVGDRKSLQRLAADLARITSVTPENESTVRTAVNELSKLRRLFNEMATELQ